MSEEGIYYIATGNQFVREAEVSAQSVRDSMPEMPIAIASDVEPDFDFDYEINISEPEYGFVDQINHLHRSPFKQTIHFDTDIFVGSDVSELIELLGQFDICAAYNHHREACEMPGVPDCFPEYNTGVLAYNNNEEFGDFTHQWKENYKEFVTDDNTQNQPSFRKTLYESDLRVATLTPEYNCMVRYPGHVKNKVKIVHSRLLNITTPGSNQQINLECAIQQLNKYQDHRLYIPDNDQGVNVIYGDLPPDAPIHQKGMNSLRTDGLIYTVKNAIPFLIRRFRGNPD